MTLTFICPPLILYILVFGLGTQFLAFFRLIARILTFCDKKYRILTFRDKAEDAKMQRCEDAERV